jgi:hypothetical protein
MEDKAFLKAKHDPLQNQSITALYSDIGRGHPSYLDSLVTLLKKRYPHLVCRTVFEESKGLSLLGWRFLSWLYRTSGKGGLTTKFYNSVRKRSQRGLVDSLVTKILGRDLKRAYKSSPGICLVEHPIVARSLANTCRVWYVHGEIAAPLECAIKGVEKILVPLEETKAKLTHWGAERETILVCGQTTARLGGLMIEPALVDIAETSYQKRLKRIRSNRPLTVGFFTSGAYPKEHMEKIVLGAKSVIEKKMKAVIFCGTNPQKFAWVKNKVINWGVKIVEDKEKIPHENEEFDLLLVFRKTRQEDTQRAVELISHLDIFVAASHERTNWAVGVGLPMFVLFPLIGTFASQNFEFAQKQKVVYPLDSLEKAKNLGEILSGLQQSGQLLQMAQNGFGAFGINGIEIAVDYLLENLL